MLVNRRAAVCNVMGYGDPHLNPGANDAVKCLGGSADISGPRDPNSRNVMKRFNVAHAYLTAAEQMGTPIKRPRS
jgi:hypothetical protein